MQYMILCWLLIKLVIMTCDTDRNFGKYENWKVWTVQYYLGFTSKSSVLSAITSFIKNNEIIVVKFDST